MTQTRQRSYAFAHTRTLALLVFAIAVLSTVNTCKACKPKRVNLKNEVWTEELKNGTLNKTQELTKKIIAKLEALFGANQSCPFKVKKYSPSSVPGDFPGAIADLDIKEELIERFENELLNGIVYYHNQTANKSYAMTPAARVFVVFLNVTNPEAANDSLITTAVKNTLRINGTVTVLKNESGYELRIWLGMSDDKYPSVALKDLADAVKSGSVDGVSVIPSSFLAYSAFPKPSTKKYQVTFDYSVSECIPSKFSNKSSEEYKALEKNISGFLNGKVNNSLEITIIELKCGSSNSRSFRAASATVKVVATVEYSDAQDPKGIASALQDCNSQNPKVSNLQITLLNPSNFDEAQSGVSNPACPTSSTTITSKKTEASKIPATGATTQPPVMGKTPRLFVRLRLALTWSQFCSKLEESLKESIARNVHDKKGNRVSSDRVVFINARKNCADPSKDNEQVDLWFYIANQTGSERPSKCITLKAYRVLKMMTDNGNTNMMGSDFKGKIISLNLAGCDAKEFENKDKMDDWALILIIIALIIGAILLFLACCCICCGAARRRRRRRRHRNKYANVEMAVVDVDGNPQANGKGGKGRKHGKGRHKGGYYGGRGYGYSDSDDSDDYLCFGGNRRGGHGRGGDYDSDDDRRVRKVHGGGGAAGGGGSGDGGGDGDLNGVDGAGRKGRGHRKGRGRGGSGDDYDSDDSDDYLCFGGNRRGRRGRRGDYDSDDDRRGRKGYGEGDGTGDGNRNGVDGAGRKGRGHRKGRGRGGSGDDYDSDDSDVDQLCGGKRKRRGKGKGGDRDRKNKEKPEVEGKDSNKRNNNLDVPKDDKGKDNAGYEDLRSDGDKQGGSQPTSFQNLEYGLGDRKPSADGGYTSLLRDGRGENSYATLDDASKRQSKGGSVGSHNYEKVGGGAGGAGVGRPGDEGAGVGAGSGGAGGAPLADGAAGLLAGSKADENKRGSLTPAIVTSPAPDSGPQTTMVTSGSPGPRRGSGSRGGSPNSSRPSSGSGLRDVDDELQRERRRSSIHSLLDDDAEPLKHKTATVGIVGLALRNKNEKKKETEFKNLDKDMPALGTYPASTAGKNRNPDILPNPRSRVKLSSTPDYINASYLHDHKGQRHYIATQHPLLETKDDFWRMVWEQESYLIVMVNDDENSKQIDYPQYWPAAEGSSVDFNGIVVSNKQVITKPDYVITHLVVTNTKTKPSSTREIAHYRYTSWKEKDVPNIAMFVGFVVAAREEGRKYDDSKSPIVVHCSDGQGFTGVFVALDIGIRSHEENKTSVVDLYEMAKRLRQGRNGIIGSLQLYNFSYQCLYEYTVNYDEEAEKKKEQNGNPTA